MILARWLLAAGLCAGWAYADGPKDNLPDNVRPIPPLGKLSEAEKAKLEADIVPLNNLVNELKEVKSSVTEKNLPDVLVYREAVRYATQFNEIFDEKKELPVARKMIERGQQRANDLKQGKHPWTENRGLVVHGYRSRIDNSIQPFGLVIPDNFDRTRSQPWRLDVWCHGRGETLSELNFLQQRETSKGEFTPPDTIVLHLYGRYCNANKFAGEIDCFEAIERVAQLYPIDRNRIVIRGFSMGGAACWQFASHYPGYFCAGAPGAGFSETPEFLKVFQKEAVAPPAYEQKLWGLYNATDYALNFSMIPTIAYSGEDDPQKQAALAMIAALDKEKLKIPHIIGPKTGHKYHPEAKLKINEFIDAAAKKGRPALPETVRFTTRTLRYNQCYWLTLTGLEKHWEPARFEGKLNLKEAKKPKLVITTANVDRFELRFPADTEALANPLELSLDGKTFTEKLKKTSDGYGQSYHKTATGWQTDDPSADTSLRKRPGLQGPIDDAFMDRFIFVVPGQSLENTKQQEWVQKEMQRAIREWRKVFRGEPIVRKDNELTEREIQDANLILWGDAKSNQLLAKIADKLPLLKDAYPGDRMPILIYPNPLNAKKYVVINSGVTFREYDLLNNARQVPKLPDWAWVDITVPPNSRSPGKIIEAGFFDEKWQK